MKQQSLTNNAKTEDMKMYKKEFSHVSYFTGYMKKIYDFISNDNQRLKILDIPAGNGLLGLKLKEDGHEVICADINKEKKDFVFANMADPLPFEDDEFDIVICMEGLEHLINPAQTISELCRVSKNRGKIIISLPNIQNLYSRLQFLCTGTFFLFSPTIAATNYKDEKSKHVDLGHISSLSFVQLRWLFSYYGADLLNVSGDKFKRKLLIPLLSPFLLLGYFWQKQFKENEESYKCKLCKSHLINKNLLFSRSLILVFQKKNI
jgi:SAM-dependent methyltransferase